MGNVCIIKMAFNAPCDRTLMLLTHHAFLIVIADLNTVCHSLLPNCTKYLHLWKSHRMKPELTENSQNKAYWPVWVFKVAIFISLVQGANHQNISLWKYRHILLLICQHATKKLCHWCIFQLPPPPYTCI